MTKLDRARWLLPATTLSAGIFLATCNKSEAPPTPDAVAAAPQPASAAGAAPADPVAPAPSADAAEVKVEKSEELRFIEANAELVCFERANKRAPKDKDRVEILKNHGFLGKRGEASFLELSIRGEKDRDWGRRTAERIAAETQGQCPAQKK
ncbi:MAG: hypothetical protein HY904_23585 [Deltaproteobacteria bacterium]|nr:hypothetical protein [Deltaproteobacteria bacterium]